MTAEVIGVARYTRYRDSYVLAEGPRSVQFSDTVVRRSWLMDRSGKGLFLASHAVAVKSNGAAGGYLQDGNQLFRIIIGLPGSFDVAPDGCNVALSIYDKTESETAIPCVKAINVCRGSTS